jgi:hypothetical protein
MKCLARTGRMVACAALVLGAVGLAAVPASASTGSARARDVPAATADLYFCDYDTNGDNIAAWEWPGGAGRSGNTAYVRAASPIGFNSIPWISSGTINGQRWIYGAMLIPSASGGGSIEYVYGWVGRDYLNIINQCGYDYFSTSNAVIATTSTGDPFSSEPSEISATFQGQTWVWGEDPYVSTRAGWVGSSWLTLDSCTSSGCFYTIKNDGVIHEWVLPGGSPGP